jgi:transcriptional regulator with XRE-family HTH domain
MSRISDVIGYHRCMNMKVTFGEWLSGLLEEKNLTQAQFGEAVGVSPSTVNAWARGVQPPSRRNAIRMAGYVQLPRREVFGYAEIEMTAADRRIVVCLRRGSTVQRVQRMCGGHPEIGCSNPLIYSTRRCTIYIES